MEIEDALRYERYLQYGAKPALMFAETYVCCRFFNRFFSPLSLSLGIKITAINVVACAIFDKYIKDPIIPVVFYIFCCSLLLNVFWIKPPPVRIVDRCGKMGTFHYITSLFISIVSRRMDLVIEQKRKEEAERIWWQEAARMRRQEAYLFLMRFIDEWRILFQRCQKDLMPTTDSSLPDKYKEFKEAICLGKTYVEVLGLDGNATVDQVNQQYKKFARVIHPDKLGSFRNNDVFCTENDALFKALTEAKELCLKGMT